jgi:hypothetical protein
MPDRERRMQVVVEWTAEADNDKSLEQGSRRLQAVTLLPENPFPLPWEQGVAGPSPAVPTSFFRVVSGHHRPPLALFNKEGNCQAGWRTCFNGVSLFGIYSWRRFSKESVKFAPSTVLSNSASHFFM